VTRSARRYTLLCRCAAPASSMPIGPIFSTPVLFFRALGQALQHQPPPLNTGHVALGRTCEATTFGHDCPLCASQQMWRLMSHMGQTAKYSQRAFVVCDTLDSGHRADMRARPSRAIFGHTQSLPSSRKQRELGAIQTLPLQGKCSALESEWCLLALHQFAKWSVVRAHTLSE
jgi:hypothetical protein